MAHYAAPGRHRAPGRHNPVAEITTILGRAGGTGAKASVVLAASGALVAAFALPANAAPAGPTATATSTSAAKPAVKLASALVAPAVHVPYRATSFGLVGITAVAKPKPKPKVVRAARSTTSGTTVRANRAVNRATRPSAARSTTARKAANVSRSASVTPARGGVVGIAMSLLGIYYVYGGSTPAGFDCSGFTSYVYRQVGVSLPRTAAGQQAAARRVSSPQPGDLVFFGYPAYHVGIYAGNGMMIDSPRTGKATSLRAIWDKNATFGRP